MNTMNPTAVKDFMHSYGIAAVPLARVLDIKHTLLSQKLNPAYRNRLSEKEQEQILSYFRTLRDDLNAFLATDLNELPERLKTPETEEK